MEKEGNKHDNRDKSVKCKYCKMGFENKEIKGTLQNSAFWKRRKKRMIMGTNPFLSLYAMSF